MMFFADRSLVFFAAALLPVAAFAQQFGPMPTAGPPLSKRPIVGHAAPSVSPLTLWYRSPAKLWTDALAIGNGRLGAMIFGGPEHDRLQINDITVWSGGPLPHADRPDAYQSLPAIREALKHGDYALATKLVSEHMTTIGTGDSDYFPSYETLGNLDFEHTLPTGPITGYLRTLDIGRAVSTTDFTVNGVHYHRESFASHPDRAIVSRISSDTKGQVSFTVRLSRVAAATTTPLGQNVLVMCGDTTFPAQPAVPARPPITEGPRKGFPGRPAKPAMGPRPGNLDYEVELRVTTHGGAVHAEGDHITVSGADDATLVLVDGTSYVLDWNKAFRGADQHAAAADAMESVANKTFANLEAAHVADYRRLFDRVNFTLPTTPAANNETSTRIQNYGDGARDPSLATLYYQMGRYLLISSSREDNPLPSNSQGLWGDGLDLPWKCDYKSNINYQMNYWPSETANLSELHLPAIRFDAALIAPGAKTAQTYYNAPGWVVAYTANAWGWTSPGSGMPWGPFFGGGGWLMQDIWEHYAFSRDRDFLRSYYPVLRGSAEFYLSILQTDANGHLITSPSLSPENRYMTDTGVEGSVVDGSAVEPRDCVGPVHQHHRRQPSAGYRRGLPRQAGRGQGKDPPRSKSARLVSLKSGDMTGTRTRRRRTTAIPLTCSLRIPAGRSRQTPHPRLPAPCVRRCGSVAMRPPAGATPGRSTSTPACATATMPSKYSTSSCASPAAWVPTITAKEGAPMATCSTLTRPFRLTATSARPAASTRCCCKATSATANSPAPLRTAT